MKKVMIITLYGYENYGNKLQNYALQEAIKLNGNGYEVETLKNTFRDERKSTILNKIKRLSLKKIILKITKKQSNPIGDSEYNKLKQEKLKKFNDKYIKDSKYVVTNNNPVELNKMYDYFVVGSDQIWNPSVHTPFEINFALFADKNKKISYAASFGVSSIPKQYTKIYNEGLNNIKNISVREEQGINIIKQITGRQDAVVTLDPTMLLTPEKWREISELPKNVKPQQYILIYFLGGISEQRQKMLDKIAKENNLIIIDVLKKQEIIGGVAGIEEFLGLVDNAKIVLTDSFHACVFSILFKTSFYALNREGTVANMSSRIDTLLQTFNLQQRKLNNYNQKIDFNINYTNVDDILEREREKSLTFLKNSLNN